MARRGRRRRRHDQLDPVGRLEQSQRSPARRGRRRRVDRRLGGAARPLQRIADQNHRRLFPAELGCDPRSAGSDITEVSDLAGKSVAATKGTDPYFFLIQALNEAGIPLADVDIQNLQHADGKAALESGAVDAWSGLDPLLSTSVATAGSTVIYDNIDFNSYGFLNATESFLEASPDLAQLVVNAYEKARAWAIDDPAATADILAEVAGIDPTIAATVVDERTNFDIDPVPGAAQSDVLAVIGPIFVESGDVKTQGAIDDALDSLFDTTYADAADPSAIG